MKFLSVFTLLLSFSVFANESTVSVSNAWIKAVPPVAKMSAAFMDLKNNADKDRTLVDVKANFSKGVELHTNKKVDVVMKMRPLKKLSLPAGESVSLKPGGHHIMFIGLKNKLKKGEKKELELIFQNGENLKVKLPVKREY